MAAAISQKVNNAYLSYISMRVSPQRLQCWGGDGDARRSVVRSAHQFFLSPPLNDMQERGWVPTGHRDTRGDPGPAKMDQPLYGSKMLMGTQGHRVHLSCPVLK